MGAKLSLFAVEENPRACEAGEVIFRQYDMASEMYVVLEGEVELTLGDTLIETVGPGEPFGEMALIDQAPRAATATTKTHCKLALIPDKPCLFTVQTTLH